MPSCAGVRGCAERESTDQNTFARDQRDETRNPIQPQRRRHGLTDFVSHAGAPFPRLLVLGFPVGGISHPLPLLLVHGFPAWFARVLTAPSMPVIADATATRLRVDFAPQDVHGDKYRPGV